MTNPTDTQSPAAQTPDSQTPNALSLNGQSLSISKQRQQELKQLFPGVFTETRNDQGELVQAIDFERLKAELGEFSELYDNHRERYGMDWPGKRDCLKVIQQPSLATLKPCREESVEFDASQNLFIEGDNLEVLKLLQKSYYGAVKMIYIDPPYNTGKEFIYPDNYAESLDTYLKYAGLKDSDGKKFTSKNSGNEGRFHTNWLNMMYPRLYLARNLLREDGYLVASIDDAEFENFRNLLNEIFGEENHIATLVWDRNRKNDARYFSVGHEYMLVYSRNASFLAENKIRLKEPQEGLSEAMALFKQLVAQHGDDWEGVKNGWMDWFKNIPLSDPKRRLMRFTKVGPRGPYRDDGNISWPGGNGPRYEVLHPETRKPVPIPSRGWVFPNETRFWEEYENGRVVFGEDHTTSARIASYLFESDGQVMPSVFYSYAQTAAQDFSDLMGDKLFDNPKNWKDIERLIYYLTEPSDLVLDFFSGSGTTGHAICHSNISEPASRRFILVQLPEPCPTSSIALKNGMATIADIAKERLRRAGARLKSEQSAQLDLESNPEYQPDLGFKVFKLDRSNFKQWQAPSSAVSDGDLLQQMELSIDPVLPEATPEQMLYEILLKIGLPLTAEVTNIELAGAPVYSVEDGLVLIFLQGQMHQALIDAVLDAAPSQFICLDKAFEGNDQLKANAVKTFAHYNAGFEGDSERIDFRTL